MHNLKWQRNPGIPIGLFFLKVQTSAVPLREISKPLTVNLILLVRVRARVSSAEIFKYPARNVSNQSCS